MSVLESDPATELTPKRFGAVLARRLGRHRAFSDQTVRNWIAEGMPAKRKGRGFVITDPDRAAEWWRVAKGYSEHGGERPGAGGRVAESAGSEIAGSGSADSGSAGGGLTDRRGEKLSIETKLKELEYQKKLGQVIDRQEAAEGTSRVLGAFVRELAKLPDRLAAAIAERLRLAPEEMHVLSTITHDEVHAMRRAVAEQPLGVDEDGDDGAQGTGHKALDGETA